MTIRVLIAEDHPMFREALHALLDGSADVAVVAITGTVRDLLTQVRETSPDVAVVDLHLADGSSLSALEQLHTIAPDCRVLILTSSEDDAAVYSALRSGARGYLLKSATASEISRAVRTVADGDGVFDGTVLEQINRHLNTGGRSPASTVFPQLSIREGDVLAMMARGLSNAEIADLAIISLKTVRNNVSNIFTKLGVATRAQAIVTAREAGLTETAPP